MQTRFLRNHWLIIFQFIVIRRYYRLVIYMCWSFYSPVTCFLSFEPTSIADKRFYFAPLVFTCRYSDHFFSFIPKGYFARTFTTITASLNWLGKPNPALESKSFIGKGTHWTHIDHVSREVVINSFFYVSGNLSSVASVED